MPKIAKNPETNRPWTRKTLRKAWIKALRSKKYEQTKGRLRNRKGFCCLGVLCDVYDPSKWRISRYEDYEYETKFYSLPEYLLNFVGLIEHEDKDKQLWRLNDTFDKSFSEIADILEKREYWKDA